MGCIKAGNRSKLRKPIRESLANKRDKCYQYDHNVAMLISKEKWIHVQKSYGFTERQMQIFKLLFEGLDGDRIARRLKIRYNTVKAHFGHMYKRAGVQNKAELIMQIFNVLQTYNKSHKPAKK
jgi:DNA-binding NarL/FixJ family response regulator